MLCEVYGGIGFRPLSWEIAANESPRKDLSTFHVWVSTRRQVNIALNFFWGLLLQSIKLPDLFTKLTLSMHPSFCYFQFAIVKNFTVRRAFFGQAVPMGIRGIAWEG